MKTRASGRSEQDWKAECVYISDVTDCGGQVFEMNYCLATFRRYCELQRNQARRDGQHDAAEHIEQCLADLEAIDQ